MDRPRHDSVRLAALSITVLVALSLSATGCGGGSDGSSGTAESTAAESTATGEVQGTHGGGTGGGGSAHREGDQRSHSFRGGEKDIEGFGSEATGSEAKAVLSAERTYLSAIVSRNYGRACMMVSRSLRTQFSEIVESGAGAKTCAQVMPRLLSGDASHVAALQLSGRVVKVRVEGERGYVVFHAPGARLFVFPMIREGGAWHVATITSSILAPSAATLGE
jgi:hypothetical protein